VTHAQYCIVAALLLTLLPGDITYVCVTGLFLAMKVKNSAFKLNLN
jgi:hypothetical protein